MKERSYNVRDEEASAEMKEKCLDGMNGDHGDSTVDGKASSMDKVESGKKDHRRPAGFLGGLFETNKASLVVVLLCVLLLVFFIIIIALAVRVGQLQGRTDPVHCATSECLGASSMIVSNWNTTFDPCKDFWKYSCGEWLSKNPLPNNKGSLGVSDLVKAKVRGRIRHLLDLVPYDASVRDPEWKAHRFYHSCMNVEAVDQTENAFKNKVNELGGWVLLNNWSLQRWEKATVIERLHTEYGVTPFFRIVIEPDDLAQTSNIIKILPAGLGLPSPRYYFLSPDNKYETVYKAYMDDVARQLGATVADSSRFATDTFNFEKRLAETTPSPESYREPFDHYKRLTVHQLMSVAPTVGWLGLLQKYFPGGNIRPDTEVVIFSQPYFEQLSNILSTTDSRAMHNYLMWQFTFTYAPHLSNSFREIANRFYQYLEGVPNPTLKRTDRWEYCLDLTSEYLGHSLGAMYVKHYFVPDSNTEAGEVNDKIKEAFRNYLSGIPWAEDYNTRNIIGEKIDSLLSIRGYPEFITKPQSLLEYYNALNVQSDFLENIKSGKYFMRQKLESRLKSQVSSDESWPIYPHDVEPVYLYHGNQLVIPAALLQEPIYEPGLPLSVRYGALGTHIASQMFKALDDKGISYHKHGTLNPWLSGHSAQRYQHKMECLKERILENTQSDMTSANLTVGELIADIAAVKFAYQAYSSMDREHDLPGLGVNHDRVFFIAYAQSMCENIRQDKINHNADFSTSSPHEKRVQNTLRQMPEFSQAFSCSSRSEMNNAKSCHMW